jgi:hypothetical protein
LGAVGFTETDLEACARLAAEDLATITNPRPVRSPSEVIDIYRKAI